MKTAPGNSRPSLGVCCNGELVFTKRFSALQLQLVAGAVLLVTEVMIIIPKHEAVHVPQHHKWQWVWKIGQINYGFMPHKWGRNCSEIWAQRAMGAGAGEGGRREQEWVAGETESALNFMCFLALGTRYNMVKKHTFCQIFFEHLSAYHIFKSLDYTCPKDVRDFKIAYLTFSFFFFFLFFFFSKHCKVFEV